MGRSWRMPSPTTPAQAKRTATHLGDGRERPAEAQEASADMREGTAPTGQARRPLSRATRPRPQGGRWREGGEKQREAGVVGLGRGSISRAPERAHRLGATWSLATRARMMTRPSPTVHRSTILPRESPFHGAFDGWVRRTIPPPLMLVMGPCAPSQHRHPYGRKAKPLGLLYPCRSNSRGYDTPLA